MDLKQTMMEAVAEMLGGVVGLVKVDSNNFDTATKHRQVHNSLKVELFPDKSNLNHKGSHP